MRQLRFYNRMNSGLNLLGRSVTRGTTHQLKFIGLGPKCIQ